MQRSENIKNLGFNSDIIYEYNWLLLHFSMAIKISALVYNSLHIFFITFDLAKKPSNFWLFESWQQPK